MDTFTMLTKYLNEVFKNDEVFDRYGSCHAD